jgi:ParB-like chromosome segregation protein Spo0J
VLGLATGGLGDRPVAGHIDGRAVMPQNVPKPPDPQRAAQAGVQTRLITLRLKQVDDPAQQQDEFANRFGLKYKLESLTDLLEDIKLHGMIEPVQVAKGPDGKWRIISGHRRIAVLYILARQGVPGFSEDMEVPVIEVQNASHLHLLVRSIATNELGERLDVKERLLAVKKLDADQATKKEMASCLKVSEKSIERDLRLARDERLLQHVMDDHLPPTAASALAEIAAKNKRLDEFLDYFDGFVSRKKKEIEDEDRHAKHETGKGLKPSQVLVANRLEPHVVRGWIDALAKGHPLTEEPDLGFQAAFDRKTGVATIKVRLDATRAPVEHVARAASQISKVAKRMAAVAKTRHELEAPEGPQAALQDADSFLDLDLLTQFGLDDVAIQLEQELQAGEQSSGRTPDQDLTGTTEGTL